MRIKKKKSIKELETKLEQFIVNTGWSKENIQIDYIAYRALKKRIHNSDSLNDDDDIWQMKDLHNVFLMGMNSRNRQNKINAASKVAAATAATTAVTIATSNLANTSKDTNTYISSSASTSINVNEITASCESAPPPSSNPCSTTHHLCLLLMTKSELALTSTLCRTSRLFLLHDPSTKSPPLHCLLHIWMHPIYPWLAPNCQNALG